MKTLILTAYMAVLCVYVKAQGVKYILPSTISVYDVPSFAKSKKVGNAIKGDTVVITGYSAFYWNIRKNNISAWAMESDLPLNSTIKQFKDTYLKQLERIKPTSIQLGIYASDVIDLIGEPNSKNTTTGSFGVFEQWVYQKYNDKVHYYYFENGKLTSWQE